MTSREVGYPGLLYLRMLSRRRSFQCSESPKTLLPTMLPPAYLVLVTLLYRVLSSAAQSLVVTIDRIEYGNQASYFVANDIIWSLGEAWTTYTRQFPSTKFSTPLRTTIHRDMRPPMEILMAPIEVPGTGFSLLTAQAYFILGEIGRRVRSSVQGGHINHIEWHATLSKPGNPLVARGIVAGVPLCRIGRLEYDTRPPHEALFRFSNLLESVNEELATRIPELGLIPHHGFSHHQRLYPGGPDAVVVVRPVPLGDQPGGSRHDLPALNVIRALVKAIHQLKSDSDYPSHGTERFAGRVHLPIFQQRRDAGEPNVNPHEDVKVADVLAYLTGDLSLGATAVVNQTGPMNIS